MQGSHRIPHYENPSFIVSPFCRWESNDSERLSLSYDRRCFLHHSNCFTSLFGVVRYLHVHAQPDRRLIPEFAANEKQRCHTYGAQSGTPRCRCRTAIEFRQLRRRWPGTEIRLIRSETN